MNNFGYVVGSLNNPIIRSEMWSPWTRRKAQPYFGVCVVVSTINSRESTSRSLLKTHNSSFQNRKINALESVCDERGKQEKRHLCMKRKGKRKCIARNRVMEMPDEIELEKHKDHTTRYTVFATI